MRFLRKQCEILLLRPKSRCYRDSKQKRDREMFLFYDLFIAYAFRPLWARTWPSGLNTRAVERRYRGDLKTRRLLIDLAETFPTVPRWLGL